MWVRVPPLRPKPRKTWIRKVNYHRLIYQVCGLWQGGIQEWQSNLTSFLEGYQSGRTEVVLKTICPQGHGGSNPSPSATNLRIVAAASINKGHE